MSPASLHAPTAVVCAMEDEWRLLRAELAGEHEDRVGGQSCWLGTLSGHAVVLAPCGIGKVAAAATAARLIHRHGVERLLLTGVAGGLAPQVHVGDWVVARRLVQHDLNAEPLFARFEVPGLGQAELAADTALSDALSRAAQALLAPGGASPTLQASWAKLGITAPRLHEGLIATGDQFIGSLAASSALRQALPEALAVEMEGAAIAQVCVSHGLPFAVLRAISDRADDAAHIDFSTFVREVAARCAAAAVLAWLAQMA